MIANVASLRKIIYQFHASFVGQAMQVKVKQAVITSGPQPVLLRMRLLHQAVPDAAAALDETAASIVSFWVNQPGSHNVSR